MDDATLAHFEFALVASQSLWVCICLTWWLWRHRRVKPVTMDRRRRDGAQPFDASRSSHPRAKPAWVGRKVLYLASHLHSCRQIAHAFNRWHGGSETIGKTWVAEFVRQHAEEIRQLRRIRKRRAPHAIPVGHLWALDLTFIRSPFGFTFTVLAILDAGSRKLLHLKVLPRKCVFQIMGHVLLACSQFGPPEEIRTDNEAMFTSRPWLAMLGALGVRCRRGPPLQPWHNGRIERFWATLKQAVRGTSFETSAALQAALDSFACSYNTIRPHQALAGLTPEEAWRGKSMADVQLAHAEGSCDRQLEEVLVGFHVRC